jgi:hypothetical protein
MLDISKDSDGIWHGSNGALCVSVLPDGETRLWNRVMQQPFKKPPVKKSVVGSSIDAAHVYLTLDGRIAMFDRPVSVPAVLRSARPYPPYVKKLRWMGVNIYRPTPRNIIVTKRELI